MIDAPLILGYGVVEAIVLAVVAAASTYASYSAQQAASKRAATQAQMNANAEAASADAAAKTAAEQQNAQARAKVAEQRRFRQQQTAAISGQGVLITGTPLDILADSEVQNQLDLSNLAWSSDVNQRNIAHQRASALAGGANGAATALANGPNRGATILSGAASAVNAGYGAYQNTPRTPRTTSGTVP